MWGIDDAASNGTCSDSQSSPVNGTAQHDHNSVSAAATAGCSMSNNDESHTSHYVMSKFSNEKTALLKSVMCHNTSSEASDTSVSHSDVLSSADSVAMPPSAASLNCHSATRTSRHLYSEDVADDDGYFINNTHRNIVSASDADTDHVSESVCSDCLPTNGVDVRSSLVPTSINETVHSRDHTDHNYACMLHDSRCSVSEQTSVGAEANSSSTTNIDLTGTLSSAFANADLCDDGYMDDMDIVASTTMVGHQHGHSAAWFVETDACLDDFIDADIPHNAAVAGSPSSSSLSSTHDESTRVSEDSRSNPSDRVTDSAVNISESDMLVNSRRESHENLHRSSNTEECGTVAHSCRRLGDSNNEHAACASQSETQLSHSDRCSESDTLMEHSYYRVNMQIQSSSPASESSHDTPPASLPSPSDDYCGSAAAAFLAAVTDNEVFEGLGTAVRKHSETHDRPTGVKQNQCYWLPVGPESDVPKFGCWSCVEVMNNASVSLPDGYGTAGRPRPCDGRDSDVMWRSATGDYISSDFSDPVTDKTENSVASVLSTRMSSSLTL